MKRRMTGFLIILVLCAAAGFAAYAGNSFRTGQTAKGQEEETVIKWLIFGEKYKESDYVFDKFNEELQTFFPGTRVEFEVVSKKNYEEKWDMKMATNETVDIAWLGSDTLNYTEEVKKGSLMALDYLIKAHGKDLKEKIPEYLWELQYCDGNTYGIPIPGALYRKNYALVANENLMKRYGDIEKIGEINRSNQYTTKECLNSFEEFLKNAKENNAIGTGVSYKTFSQIADKGYEGIYGSNSPFVIKIFDDTLRVYNKYELANYKTYFETMADWYESGYIRKDVADVLNPYSEDGKLKGSILFIDEYGENGTVPDMITTEYEAVREDLEGYKYISYAPCRNSIVIPKSSEYPRRAMEIINLLVSEEGQDLYRLLANGIEKEHYIIVKDHVIARMSDNSGGYLYTVSQYTLGDVFQNYELSEGEFVQLYEYNTKAITSPLLGFDLDTRMIALEMAKVDLIVEEYKEQLCQGNSENWEELYREFILAMKEAGSDKVIEEIQRQINEFVKENPNK